MKHFLKSAATAFLCLAASVTASAYDFEENGIYYNVLSEEQKTCEVTYECTTVIMTITATMRERLSYLNRPMVIG